MFQAVRNKLMQFLRWLMPSIFGDNSKKVFKPSDNLLDGRAAAISAQSQNPAAAIKARIGDLNEDAKKRGEHAKCQCIVANLTGTEIYLEQDNVLLAACQGYSDEVTNIYNVQCIPNPQKKPDKPQKQDNEVG